MNLTDIRAKFPEYGDMSDQELAKGLHRAYYSDMPFETFAGKIGLAAPADKAAPAPKLTTLARAPMPPAPAASVSAADLPPMPSVAKADQELASQLNLTSQRPQPVDARLHHAPDGAQQAERFQRGDVLGNTLRGIPGGLTNLASFHLEGAKSLGALIGSVLPGAAGEPFRKYAGEHIAEPLRQIIADPVGALGNGAWQIIDPIGKQLLGDDQTRLRMLQEDPVNFALNLWLVAGGAKVVGRQGARALDSIRKSELYRRATVQERGLVMQSAAETLAKNPNMTEADLARMSQRFFQEFQARDRAHAVRAAEQRKADAAGRAQEAQAGLPPTEGPIPAPPGPAYGPAGLLPEQFYSTPNFRMAGPREAYSPELAAQRQAQGLERLALPDPGYVPNFTLVEPPVETPPAPAAPSSPQAEPAQSALPLQLGSETARKAARSPQGAMEASPAPEVSARPEEAPQATAAQVRQGPPLGPPTKAKTRNSDFEFRWLVVDARDLITSHDAKGAANPQFPQEFQPRDRTRPASQGQVADIQNRLDPERLGESPMAADGAPVVGPDMVVESGNARTNAIREAYRAMGAPAREYRTWLMRNSTKYGQNPAEVANMPAPVLVRVRTTDLDPASRQKFVREANESPVASMSAAEQAPADGRSMIESGLLDLFVPNESGLIDTAANRPFVRKFIEQVSPAERGSLVDAQGVLSQAGVARIRNALFAAAYGESNTLARLSESTGDRAKNVSNALANMSPKFAKLRQAIERGNRHDLNIADHLVKAADKIQSLREQGVSLEQYLGQQGFSFAQDDPLVLDLLQVFNKHGRGNRYTTVAAVLDEFVRMVDNLGSPKQKSFGLSGTNLPTRAELLDAALQKVESYGAQGRKQSAGLFQGSPADSSPTVEAGRTPERTETQPEPAGTGRGDTVAAEPAQPAREVGQGVNRPAKQEPEVPPKSESLALVDQLRGMAREANSVSHGAQQAEVRLAKAIKKMGLTHGQLLGVVRTFKSDFPPSTPQKLLKLLTRTLSSSESWKIVVGQPNDFASEGGYLKGRPVQISGEELGNGLSWDAMIKAANQKGLELVNKPLVFPDGTKAVLTNGRLKRLIYWAKKGAIAKALMIPKIPELVANAKLDQIEPPRNERDGAVDEMRRYKVEVEWQGRRELVGIVVRRVHKTQHQYYDHYIEDIKKEPEGGSLAAGHPHEEGSNRPSSGSKKTLASQAFNVKPTQNQAPINLTQVISPTKGGQLPLELPEIVEVAEALASGRTPKIMKKLRAMGGQAAGIFRAKNGGIIDIRADMFKSPQDAAWVLAHEIGHLVDYLPDRYIKRGNLLGRVATLQKHMAPFLAGVGRDAAIRKELQGLTQTLKPFNVSTVPKSYKAYRYSGPELYADALSTLINNPNMLKAQAPGFYAAFFKFLDRKPEVKRVYEEIQTRLTDPNAIWEGRQRRIKQGFAAGNKARMDKAQTTPKQVKEEAARGAIDRASEIYRLAKKSGVKSGNVDVVRKWEESILASSEIEALARDVYSKVIEPLQKGGASDLEMAGLLMFGRRVVQERGEIANPWGFSPKEMTDHVDGAIKRLGPQKASEIEAKLDELNRLRQKHVIPVVEASGMFSGQLMAKMKSNNVYARFNVVEQLAKDGSGGPGLGQVFTQMGTLKAIENPLVATVLGDFGLIHAARSTMAKKSLTGTLRRDFPGDISPAKRGAGGALKEPAGKEQGLIKYLQKGKVVGFYVPRGLARMFEYHPSRWQGVLNVASMITNVPRSAFTGRNPYFWIRQTYKDVADTMKNLPGGPLQVWQLVPEYFRAMPSAWRAARGRPDEFVKQMLRDKALMPTHATGTPSSNVHDAISLALTKKGIQGLDPNATPSNKLLKPSAYMWDFLGAVGAMQARMTKIAAQRYLDKNFGHLSVETKAYLVRNFSGDPPYYRSGEWMPVLNNLYLFLNANIQGHRRSIQALRYSQEQAGGSIPKSEMFVKSIMYGLIPRLIMHSAEAGLLGKGLYEFYKKYSEYQKTNYLFVPLGYEKDSDEALGFRIPLPHDIQLVGGLLRLMLGDPTKLDLDRFPDALAYTGAQGPNLNPIISVLGNFWKVYLEGINPLDSFKGRPIIPETAFKAGGKFKAKEFGRYVYNQFSPIKIEPGGLKRLSKTDLDKMMDTPVLGELLRAGGLVKSNYGELESARKAADAALKARVRKRVRRQEAAVEEFSKSGRVNTQSLMALSKRLRDEGLIEPSAGGRRTVILAFRKAKAIASGDPWAKALSERNSHEERAAILAELKKSKGLSNKEWVEAIKPYWAAKLINQTTVSKALEMSK